MQFQRHLYHRVVHLLGHFPALVLTGARQTGKTTLLRQTLPDYTYVTLDLPSVAEQAERDPVAFLARHPVPLLVDEVQYAPGLFRHLKSAIDANRHAMGRFVLTGSQKFPLMRSVSDSLAGRCAWLELAGLSLRERHSGGLSLEALERAIIRGAFPDLWRDPELPSQAFHSAYLAAYLERDVRQLLNVGSLRDFERFVRACAARNGQLLDKTDLARTVGVTAKTIDAWLSVLVASDQVELLEPWFVNVGKRLIKAPKLYFRDVGLVAWLLGVEGRGLATSPFLGSLWETLILAELRSSLAATGSSRTVWFYRDSTGHEVDFVVTGGGRTDLIEAKWTEHPNTSDTAALQRVARDVARTPEGQDTRTWVVCRTPNPYPIAGSDVGAIDLLELVGSLFPL
ncbi:MAG: ATP-binding protein [Myxococcales bacterium]|nr:ATP-binding protein [Myxococcales bacterium]